MHLRVRSSLPVTLGLTCCFALLVMLLGITGCRSHMVSATVRNDSSKAVRLLEVDYPSASFGLSLLAPGAEFRYQFKIQGSGPISLEYTDMSYATHKVSGPQLQTGQEGTIEILLQDNGQVTWTPHLTPSR